MKENDEDVIYSPFFYRTELWFDVDDKPCDLFLMKNGDLSGIY